MERQHHAGEPDVRARSQPSRAPIALGGPEITDTMCPRSRAQGARLQGRRQRWHDRHGHPEEHGGLPRCSRSHQEPPRGPAWRCHLHPAHSQVDRPLLLFRSTSWPSACPRSAPQISSPWPSPSTLCAPTRWCVPEALTITGSPRASLLQHTTSHLALNPCSAATSGHQGQGLGGAEALEAGHDERRAA